MSNDSASNAPPPANEDLGTRATDPSIAHPPSGEATANASRVPVAGEKRIRFPSWTLSVVALLVPAFLFFVIPPLSVSGLWDPYELNVADFGRRLAFTMFGAASCGLTGADNSMPHLNDLARPELPFTSIALGFRLFGLHEWAGRLPLAVWGFAGVLATFFAMRRLVGQRAAAFAACVLASMPLYFVQSKTMMGDIVTFASVAMSFGAGAVLLCDRSLSAARQAAWGVVLLLGCISGFYSRGLLFGVGAPLLSLGAAWAIGWAAGFRGSSWGPILLLAGASSTVRFFALLESGIPAGELRTAIGAVLHAPAKYPTFDIYIGHIAHVLAPWSGFLPFAFGRLLVPPPKSSSSEATFERESLFRLALLVAAGVFYASHAFVAAKVDWIPFVAPAVIAMVIACAIHDYERGAHPSIAVGVGTLVMAGLLLHDFDATPEKSFQAFGVFSTTFPTAFAMKSNAIWKVVVGLFAATAFLTWVERSRNRTPFEPSTYASTVSKLREAWDGTVIVVWGAMVAGASLAALAVWVAGARKFSLPISGQIRDRILDAWWVVALVPPGVLFGAIFACDAWNWIFRERTLTTRSFSRGFEPVEDLFMRVSTDAREGAHASPASASFAVGARLLLGKVWVGRGSLGELVEGDKLTKRGENFAVSVFVLLPLLVLLVPTAVFVVCYKVLGLKMALSGAIALPSGVAAYLALGILGDLLRTRAAGFIFFGTVAGTILSGAYYPALANQVSPKEVFETFERLHQSGEQLGLLGVGGRTAAYYAGGEPPTFTDSVSAYKWLVASPPGQRRFLAVNSAELKRLNRSYREQFHTNVPVVDGRSGQILLVASSLKQGEKSTNSLNRWVLASAPKPQRILDVNLNDQLRVLGYDLVDAAGRTVSDVMPGKEYHMKTYYQILSPMTQDWQAFIHVDGFQRRHNGDHQPLNGEYPMSLWLKDDIIMDDHKFKLEPNFSTGDYTLYFGFFVGETRLQVKEGPSDGQNRINGGTLRVR